MGIPILAQARLALLAGGLSVAGAAWAVGDSPRQLDRRQAVAAYAGIRPLLTNDGVTCPAGQTPVFGAITGGAGPAGGSRTTTVQFDKGGVVRVVRTWSRTPGGRPASSFEVTCSDHVDLSQRAPDDPPVSKAERCRQVEQSLRVPPSDRCDSDATRADAAAPPATAGRTASQTVVDQDIARFWQAFDAISATTDPAERLRLIQTIYIDPGTPGLHALMAARRYTAQQYVDAIVNWPRFWRSIRPLTARSGQAVLSLNDDVARFRRLYPELRPASITYAIGVLRTGGTTTGNKVLIGAELALGDETVDVSELPAPRQSRLGVFFASRPFANNAQNNIHEYVHTQQQETQGSLAQQVLREGVAELVAELVTGRKPALPVYTYGPTHDSAIRQRFTAEMRGDDYDNWLWNSASNPFGVSDVGYYVGYRIARSYYDAARDKRRAVRELIELHYDDPGAVHALIDRSGYFGSR